MSEVWLRSWRMAPLLVSMVACGTDQGSANSGVTCGEGTVLKDGKCIPQCGRGTELEAGQCVVGGEIGAAGSASQGGSESDAGSAGSDEAGSSGETEAGSGNASADQGSAGGAGTSNAGGGGTGGTAGSSNAGTGGTAGSSNAGTGGTAGSNSGGNAGSSNAGSGGSAGSGSAGSAGSGPSVPPQWLAINQSDGIYAYDVTRFPAASALITLETSPSIRSVSWSPDSHRLLYQRGSDVFSRDMTAAVPGPPLLLASSMTLNSAAMSPLSWSADSKTVATVMGPLSPFNAPLMLQVLDPTLAAPLTRTLSANVTALSWAPAGDRLLYTDGTVVHVRRVQSGVPGPDLLLDGSSFSWSPEGKAVAAVSGGNLTLTDVTQATPTPVTLSNPSVAAPTVSQVVFSPDGTSLLFVGVQIRDGARDLFKVTLKPTIGAPVRVSTGLTGTANVTTFTTSADAKWVIYNVTDSGSTSWAVDLSGTTPGNPFQPAAVSQGPWIPNTTGKFVSVYNSALSIVDLSNPAATPVAIVSSYSSFSLGPVGAMAAYNSGSHLYVRDLDHLDIPAGDIAVLNANGIGSWRWSPNGRFIAFAESGSLGQVRLLRLEGTTPSTAVPLNGIASSSAAFIWQPLGG